MPVYKHKIKALSLISLSLFLFSFQQNCLSQEDHENEIHNEISTGGGIAYSSEASGLSPAFHLHGIKGIGPKFGIGIGYEAILGGDFHQALGILFNFKPNHLLDMNIGPGLVLPSHDENAAFVLSAELAISGHIGEHFHLGPMLDAGFSAHGLHVIAGIHLGLDL